MTATSLSGATPLPQTRRDSDRLPCMKPPRALVRFYCRQLGSPHGPVGRLIASRLNTVNADRIRAGVETIHCTPGMRVADIGFGGGFGLHALLDRVGPSGHVTGVELSPTVLDMAKRTYSAQLTGGRLDLLHGSLTQLPLAHDSLDAAISINTIYFVPDSGTALGELARVIRPGGHLALGVADPDALASQPLDTDIFIQRPISQLLDQAAAASWTLVEDRRLGEDPLAYHILHFVR